MQTLFRRFWKVAAPYWFSDDKVQARLQLGAVFALTLATTGISVGFNFLGRDFYNALASELPRPLFCAKLIHFAYFSFFFLNNCIQSMIYLQLHFDPVVLKFTNLAFVLS